MGVTDRHGFEVRTRQFDQIEHWRTSARPGVDALTTAPEQRSGASSAAGRVGLAASPAPFRWRPLFTTWLWLHFAFSAFMVMSGRTYSGFAGFAVWFLVVLLARVRR